MTDPKKLLPLLLVSLALPGFCAAPLLAEEKDPLPDVKARMAVQAQKVEKEFADGRSAAYKLVRNGNPQLVESLEKLEELLAMVRADTALSVKRREVLIVTLKFDMSEVRKIATERRRLSGAAAGAVIRDGVRTEARRADMERRTADTRGPRDVAGSIIEGRGRSVADGRTDRSRFNDRYSKTLASVDKSAVPDSRVQSFPDDWAERTKKRGSGPKMTEGEKAIMKALGTTMEADYNKATFEEVLEQLRTKTGVTITVDKRALEEVGIKESSTEITLKLRATTRTVLKRMLADLGLAYVIKDQAIQITSAERARQMTTTRTYYIGDLVAVTDFRLGPIVSKLVAMQRINMLIESITKTVDPKSWQVNNPEAVGSIAFDPVSMSIVVKQTAEIHYMLGGSR
jgi:hypothetical protein